MFLEFFHKSISYHGGDNYCTSRKCECIAQKKLFEVIYSYNQLLFTEAMLCSRHCAKFSTVHDPCLYRAEGNRQSNMKFANYNLKPEVSRRQSYENGR